MNDRVDASHEKHRRRVRRRISKAGTGTVEAHVLLEAFLFPILPRVDTNPIAHALLDRFGSVRGVVSATRGELAATPGVGDACADGIRRLADRYYRRLLKSAVGFAPEFSDAATVFVRLTRADARVKFAVLFLDGEGGVVKAASYRRPGADGGTALVVSAAKRAGSRDVFIGVPEGTSPPDLSGTGINVHDIIEVSGFDAVSIL